MQTPEGKFKETFRKEFECLAHARIFISADVYKTGIPDVLGVYHGTCFVIELKCEKEVYASQRIELMRWKEAGAIAGVLRRRTGDEEVTWWEAKPTEVRFIQRFDNLEHFKIELMKWCIRAH